MTSAPEPRGPRAVEPATAEGGSPEPAARVVDGLVTLVRARVGRPVDMLQVAAALEADGVTDKTAHAEYGHHDVFTLADEVYGRLEQAPSRAPATTSRRARAAIAVRDVSHGLLYLLPSALLPLALAIVVPDRLAVTLIATSAFGWVWSGGTAWLAYRLLGQGMPVCAGRLLRWAAVGGAAIGAGAAVGITTRIGMDARPAMVVAGLLTFQMASAIAMVYRREAWLFMTMAPGAAVGVVNLVTGRPGTEITGIAAGVSLVLTLGAMVWVTVRPPTIAGWPPAVPNEPSIRAALRPELRQFGVVVVYAALSATFLLQVDARYITAEFGVAVAAAPLIVGMGVVEWRVHRFQERASELLHRVSFPWEFATAVWGRLVSELLTATNAVAVLALAFLVVLRRTGLLTTASAVLIAAHVAVAGAYFLAFIVAGHGRYGRLCAALALAIAAQLTLARLLPGGFTPINNSLAFLASAALLQVLLLTALVGELGQAWRYRT